LYSSSSSLSTPSHDFNVTAKHEDITLRDTIIMASTREGVNPLRPYYIPPTIGEKTESLPGPPHPFPRANATTGGPYASKARDIFPDLDYRDYVNDPSPSTVQSIKELLDELLWKYTSVLMAQPFEVAKTILQVRTQDDVGQLESAPSQAARPRIASPRQSLYEQVRPV
jgi:fusion and transport protein UGO1